MIEDKKRPYIKNNKTTIFDKNKDKINILIKIFKIIKPFSLKLLLTNSNKQSDKQNNKIAK